MNHLEVQYFLSVVEHGSFTEAAQSLFVSQPAISKQIRQLEEELGCSLFIRSGRTLMLTDAGHAYYTYFMHCKFQLELLQNRLQEQEQDGRIPVHIGYLDGLNPALFMPQMQKTAQLAPKPLRLLPVCYPLPELLSSLRNGHSDLIITFESTLVHDRFYPEFLTEVPRVLLYSAKRQQTDTIFDFQKDFFFLPEDDYAPSMENVLYRIFLTCGFTPHIRYAPNFATIMDRVEQNDGVFIYNQWCRQCQMPSFHHLTLSSTQKLYLVRQFEHARPEILWLAEHLPPLFLEPNAAN